MKNNKKLLAVLSVPAIASLLAVAVTTPVKAADRDFTDNSVSPAITYSYDDYTSSDEKFDSLIDAVYAHPSNFLYEMGGKHYQYSAFFDTYKAAKKPGVTAAQAYKIALDTTPVVTLVSVTSVDTVKDVLVENGTTADKLGLPTTVGVTLSDGTKDAANVAWDTTKYDGSKAGLQTITGTLSVPTGKAWTLTDAQKAVSVKVTVKALSLQVSSVNPVTSKTQVQVVLADGQDATVAANKDSYVVKVGDTQVPVTSVAYVKDAKKATLTLDLTGQNGTVTVNGVAAKDAVDFKAPEVTNVTPANLTTVYVDFSEKVDKATAENAHNYGFVVKGTATAGNVGAAELITDTRVRLTLSTLTLKAGTTYTLTAAGVNDVAGNALVSTSKDFTAVDDTTKPVVTGITQVDGKDNAILTVKFSEEVKGSGTVKLQKYDSTGKLVDVALNSPTYAVNSVDQLSDSVEIKVPRLDDGAKYCLTIAGDINPTTLTDLAGNKLDEQKADFTAVKDIVPPSVVSTTSQDGKLTIAFSEKLNSGSIQVIDALTGMLVTTILPDTTNTDATKLVYTLPNTVNGKNCIARLTNVTDLAGNAMDPQNVTFVGTQAVVKVQLFSATSTPQTDLADKTTGNALAALSANTVAVKFNTSVSKAEAENIANYKIYQTGDKTKTLAVTNAVYDDSKQTVTLTTADQAQDTPYTVEVTGLTNLDITGTTAPFAGVDYKAPVLQSVAQTAVNQLKVTFNEGAAIVPQTKVTLVSTDYSDTIPLKSSIDADGNLILDFVNTDQKLQAGKTYILRIEGVADKDKNFRAAGSTSAVVTSTQVQADTVAPKLTNAVASNAKTLELTFDEELGSAIPTVTIKDADGKVLTDNSADKITVNGKKVTVLLGTDDSKLLTGKTYSAEITGVTDLVGNAVKTTSPITTTFVGNNDTVAPKLLSAASSIVKGGDYKVGGKVVAGVTDKNYTEVTLTFDKAVQLATAKNILASIVAPDFSKLTVVDDSVQVGSDGKTVQFLLAQSTNAGDNYIVNVTPGSVTNTAVNPVALDSNANYASFTGVDTTAPVISGITVDDKDGNAVENAATVSGNTIVLTLGANTEYTPGSIKLSEDVKASIDAAGTNYDVSGISVSKNADSSALTNLALGLYGKNGATGTQLRTELNDATITLEDALGNTSTYKISVSLK